MAKRTDTAQRIVREAMRLFGEKGYERTSIADIQKAAGLRPGSGALYKHFASKEEVLKAGLDQFIQEAERTKTLIAQASGPAPDALLKLGGAALATLAHDADALRIVWRELDAFPELRERVTNERMQSTFAVVAAWLRANHERGEFQVDDPEAAAAVVLGSISMFRVFEILLGSRALDVSDERFLAAWHSIMTRGMVPPAKD